MKIKLIGYGFYKGMQDEGDLLRKENGLIVLSFSHQGTQIERSYRIWSGQPVNKNAGNELNGWKVDLSSLPEEDDQVIARRERRRNRRLDKKRIRPQFPIVLKIYTEEGRFSQEQFDDPKSARRRVRKLGFKTKDVEKTKVEGTENTQLWEVGPLSPEKTPH